jgi:hypothetical protein
MDRILKNNKRQQLKTKNRMKWLWNLIYSNIRKNKGLKKEHFAENPTVRKLGVLANRIYIRRSL